MVSSAVLLDPNIVNYSMCVAACYDEYVNCRGKRKYELRISTDCDEPVRLISWKCMEELSQSSDDQLNRYCNMLLMI